MAVLIRMNIRVFHLAEQALCCLLLLGLTGCLRPTAKTSPDTRFGGDGLFVTIKWAGVQVHSHHAVGFATRNRMDDLQKWFKDREWAEGYTKDAVISDNEARRLRSLLTAKQFLPYRKFTPPDVLTQQYVITMYAPNEASYFFIGMEGSSTVRLLKAIQKALADPAAACVAPIIDQMERSSALSKGASTRTSVSQGQTNQSRLVLNKYGFTSDWGLESINLHRLKELTPFEAKVDDITKYVEPPASVQNSARDTKTNSVRYVLTLTTAHGQRFAIQETNPGSNLIALMAYLKVWKNYHFPEVVLEAEAQAQKVLWPGRTEDSSQERRSPRSK
jgi:hypothetical protein